MSLEARNIRNAIALTVDPQTHVLWAGVAGQDDLPVGHPYEIFDAVTLQPAPVDYGWPSCYENRRQNAKQPGSCEQSAIPRVILPAYETPIGAVFYPAEQQGAHAFPAAYRAMARLRRRLPTRRIRRAHRSTDRHRRQPRRFTLPRRRSNRRHLPHTPLKRQEPAALLLRALVSTNLAPTYFRGALRPDYHWRWRA
jgi:hypothetical protein